MKLVIDIPEEIIESVKYGNVYIAGTRSNGKTILCKITDAIANATPLTDCTDAISREAVMKLLESRYSFDTVMSIYEEVLDLPSVNPTTEHLLTSLVVYQKRCVTKIRLKLLPRLERRLKMNLIMLNWKE